MLDSEKVVGIAALILVISIGLSMRAYLKCAVKHEFSVLGE